MMAKLLLAFLVIFVVMSLAILPQDAEAKKSQGTKNPQTNSKQVCGDKLCDDQPQTMEEKINDYLFKLFQKDKSLIPQGRFSIGGMGTDLFQQSVDDLFFDTVPPLIIAPDDMVVTATSNQMALVEFSVKAIDNLEGVIEVQCIPPSGSYLKIGGHLVTCHASDSAGNVAKEIIGIIVLPEKTSNEVTPEPEVVPQPEPEVVPHPATVAEPDSDIYPPILEVPNGVVAPARGPQGAEVEFEIKVTDEYDKEPELNCTPPSGSLFSMGETIVTCTARDRDGNSVEKSFSVIVEKDMTKDQPSPSEPEVVPQPEPEVVPQPEPEVVPQPEPEVVPQPGLIIIDVPSNIVITATDDTGALVEYSVKAEDHRGKMLNVDCTPPSGYVFPIGGSVVRCQLNEGDRDPVENYFSVTVKPPLVEALPEPEVTQESKDPDGDGLVSWRDRCPNEAGSAMNNGCPEVADSKVQTEVIPEPEPAPEPKKSIVIPDWVTDVAAFWCNDEIDDSGFVQVVEYLISNKVITVPETQGGGGGATQEIPGWIKSNACWWSEGLIGDDEFASGIQYLIKEGILGA